MLKKKIFIIVFFLRLLKINFIYGSLFIFCILKFKILDKFYINKYLFLKNKYIEYANKKIKYTQNWFFAHIPIWMFVFNKKLKIDLKKKYKILELGSFEGLSTVFLLKTFINSTVYSCDSFTFGENKNLATNSNFDRFKKNTNKFLSRFKFHKKNTDDFFYKNKLIFDIIYVDAFHRYDYLIKDAVNSFLALTPNRGVIIFDDFMWDRYDDYRLMPARAIIEFYSKYRKNLEIVHLGYQAIFIKKN